MRLWSLHPKYLDAKGLVALWREGLLAMHVLEGKTKGYRYHPQLQRFRRSEDPVQAINYYLCKVHEEARSRNYHFDEAKVNWSSERCTIAVSTGQLNYEVIHLRNKLIHRDPQKYNEISIVHQFEPHPIFRIVEGPVESWEILPQITP